MSETPWTSTGPVASESTGRSDAPAHRETTGPGDGSPERSGLPEVLELVSDRLYAVDAMFRRHLESPIEIVGDIGSYVADTEGKRVRPTLHLLAATMCGYEGEHDVLLATVLEYIHSATLIHDDIIDEATLRRGRASVNARFGNDVTVLFGDYMLAKAMELALEADSLEVMKRLARVTLRMTEGEMLQTRYAGRLDLSVDDYLELVDRKTAALFATCCELAGVLAGVGSQSMEALIRYGRGLGMAFQIVDDVLDLTADSETIGKPAMNDLQEGKATLAVLELLAADSPGARSAVERVASGNADGDELRALRDLLLRSGAIEKARERATRFATDAACRLDRFAPSKARAALAALPGMLVARRR